MILVAWLFGETARKPEMPANTIAIALLGVAITGLVLQPDFGQTMLILFGWGVVYDLGAASFAARLPLGTPCVQTVDVTTSIVWTP